MAHRPIAELWIQPAATGGQAMVHVQSQTPARNSPAGDSAGSNDLRGWVERSRLPAGGMMAGGLVVAGVGLALGAAFPVSLATAALFGGMVTFGGGVAFLGGLKRKADKKKAVQAALPPAPTSSPVVLAERSRRVVTWLGPQGQATFEELAAALRWTEQALVETLLHMKNNGLLDEDLDLDSGQWVYRILGATEHGHAASLMLHERQAQSS